MFKVKMMPGQEPYTEEEMKRVSSLIENAAEAEMYFADYELEDHAKKLAKETAR